MKESSALPDEVGLVVLVVDGSAEMNEAPAGSVMPLLEVQSAIEIFLELGTHRLPCEVEIGIAVLRDGGVHWLGADLGETAFRPAGLYDDDDLDLGIGSGAAMLSSGIQQALNAVDARRAMLNSEPERLRNPPNLVVASTGRGSTEGLGEALARLRSAEHAAEIRVIALGPTNFDADALESIAPTETYSLAGREIHDVLWFESRRQVTAADAAPSLELNAPAAPSVQIPTTKRRRRYVRSVAVIVVAVALIAAGVFAGHQIDSQIGRAAPLHRLRVHSWIPATSCVGVPAAGNAEAVLACSYRGARFRLYAYPTVRALNYRYRLRRASAGRVSRRAACRHGADYEWHVTRLKAPAGRLLSWYAQGNAHIDWTQAASRIYSEMVISNTHLREACRLWSHLSRKP